MLGMMRACELTRASNLAYREVECHAASYDNAGGAQRHLCMQVFAES